jgi:hypothetical protein
MPYHIDGLAPILNFANLAASLRSIAYVVEAVTKLKGKTNTRSDDGNIKIRKFFSSRDLRKG